MECPGCQHSNPPDSKFCGECGTRLQSLDSAWQTANSPTNKFCSECGQRLAAGSPSAAEPVMTASATRFGRPGVLHPEAPRRKDPHVQERDGGRAQTRHRDVLGRLGFHRDVGEARSRGRPQHHGTRLRSDHKRGAPLRGQHQPVPGRRRDGPLRRAHRSRGPSASRPECRARHPAGASASRRRRAAAARRGVPHADGDQYRSRLGRRHRQRPPHGLHGGRGHDEPGCAVPGPCQARPDRGEPAHPAPAEGVLRLRGSWRVPGQGKERAGPRLCGRQ